MKSMQFPSPLRRVALSGAVALVGATLGCAGGVTTEVAPAEIPDLAARVAQTPDDPQVRLRYAAALFSDGRCEEAVREAGRGMALAPAHALGPLVVGQCAEADGDYDRALSQYERYLAAHGDRPGAAAVRARALLARREQATVAARSALEREAELTAEPADPRAVAILPVVVAGDSSFAPLGRGLAQMITSDLALLEQFRLVERMQVGALLDELALGQTSRVDPATVARVGRLVRAGRMVQGVAAIPDRGPVRLQANVVGASSEVTGTAEVTGAFRDLLRLEKDLVIGIAGRLGYQLSAAERQRILENGTQSLTAFLAYSRGLEAEELGDYPAASLHFAGAVRADPGFGQARAQYEAASVATAAQQATPGQVTTIASQTPPPPDAGVTGEPVLNAVASSVGDLAPTQAELVTESADETVSTQQATGQSGGTSASKPPETPTGKGTTENLIGTIRIIFRIP